MIATSDSVAQSFIERSGFQRRLQLELVPLQTAQAFAMLVEASVDLFKRSSILSSV
ncbi:MAG TPA: hypothetical protein VFJ95_04540 [Gammaproteobacteria bacterium]|nr:hypothetical protein [Gammaproteobacteria bacterium]